MPRPAPRCWLPLVSAKTRPSCRRKASRSAEVHEAVRGRARSARRDRAVDVLLADPQDAYVLDALRLATGREVRRVALRSEIDDLIERWYGQGRSAMGAIVETAEGEARRPGRCRAPARPGVRSAGHPPRQPDHPARGRTARVRHPHRAVREPPEGALPHRRRARGRRRPAAQPHRRGDQPHQDHGEAEHRRAPPAAGRPHHAARAGQGARPAREHGADRARRKRGDAHARPRDGGVRLQASWASPTTSCRSSSRCSSSRTASCW